MSHAILKQKNKKIKSQVKTNSQGEKSYVY